MIILILAGIVALVVVYMTHALFLRRRISSARFFKDLPPPRRQLRFRFGKLQVNLLFFLQLAILLSVLAAVFCIDKKLSGPARQGLGVWFVVDTSASMSTMQEGQVRMAAAIREVEQAVTRVRQAARNKRVCFRLSAFDLERQDLVLEGDAALALQAVKKLQARPMGTDIGILRRLARSLQSQTRIQCRVSHLVAITDIPAPAWVSENSNMEIVWRDIAKPVDNLGFTAIRAVRNPLTGLTAEVQIQVTAYGPLPVNAEVSIIPPRGAEIKTQISQWTRVQEEGQVKTRQSGFVPDGPGLYRLTLAPGGAYGFDDTAVIAVDHGSAIRVDWQLKDRRLPGQMGWKQETANPHFRVTANTGETLNIPTLVVGKGYRDRVGDNTPSVIRDFMETSALLEDVNLDAVETLGLKGIELPAGFQPVLRGMDGTVWLAQAENPLRAYVPGLPTGTDDVLGRFSVAVFFNALRWLLQERQLNPLYTLTSPYAPEPGANRLALHKDEGNTRRVSRSSGSLEDIRPAAGKGTAIPLWPVFLMAAAVLFLLERVLSLTSVSRYNKINVTLKR